MYGYHLDEGRQPNLLVEIETSVKGSDFGAIGYMVGNTVGGGVPYFKFKTTPSTDQLKWLGAALASSGSVALYHVENTTPESKWAFEIVERG